MMSKKTARLYQRMQYGIKGKSDDIAALEEKAAKAEKAVNSPAPAAITAPATKKGAKPAAKAAKPTATPVKNVAPTRVSRSRAAKK